MLRKFQQAYHIHGILASDVNIAFTVPSDCSLVHCSAVGSNANDALLRIGTDVNASEYLADVAIGDSGIPVVFSASSFVGGTSPHIPAGIVLNITLDHDGELATAAEDVTIVLTFTEG